MFPLKNESVNIVDKLWGREVWCMNGDYCMKVLHVNSGHQCSLHYHKLKAESFLVLHGVMEVEIHIDDVKKFYKVCSGEWIHIERGMLHRFKSLTDETVMVECSTKHYDEDSYRIENSRRVDASESSPQAKQGVL